MPDARKILIIDDEIDLCRLLEFYFVRKQFEVVIAQDMEEALVKLRASPPDVLFLDNNLPGGTGWEVAPRLAAEYPAMQIVLISAFHPQLPKMPESARFHVIEKPIGFSQLDKLLPQL